jgi:hypothetical protein
MGAAEKKLAIMSAEIIEFPIEPVRAIMCSAINAGQRAYAVALARGFDEADAATIARGVEAEVFVIEMHETWPE